MNAYDKLLARLTSPAALRRYRRQARREAALWKKIKPMPGCPKGIIYR